MQVGLREANQQFSRIAPAVRGGEEEVLLTERGKPILLIRRSRRQATIPAARERRSPTTGEKPGIMPYFKLRGISTKATLREARDYR